MNRHDRASLAEAVAPSDYILLEHWTAFCGQQLTLCVTTADAARPDTVSVHVRYGGDQAEVSLRGDRDAGASEAPEQSARADGASDSTLPGTSAVVEHQEVAIGSSDQREESTFSSFATKEHQKEPLTSSDQKQESTTGISAEAEHEEATLDSSGQVQDSSPGTFTATNHPGVKVGSSVQETEPSPGTFDAAEHQEITLGSSGPEKPPGTTATTEHQEVTLGLPGEEQESGSKEAGKSDPPEGQAEKLSSGTLTYGSEVKDPGAPAEDADKTVDSENTVSQVQDENAAGRRMSTPEQRPISTAEQQNRTPVASLKIQKRAKYQPRKRALIESHASYLSVAPRKRPRKAEALQHLVTKTVAKPATSSNKTQFPKKILLRILSFLTWEQLLRVRRVSGAWRSAANICLARYSDLHIGRYNFPAILEDTTLERLLRHMPGLRRLSVDWRLDGQKLDIDVVTQHCRNLLEIDLTRFRLDTWSLEQLCTACPGLKEVKLPRKCDDSCVEVLLRNLPQLRSLDLERTKVTGRFLAQSNGSVEKLSLASCDSLKFEQLRMIHLLAGDPSQEVICWKQLRELDLSSTMVTAADVTDAFKHFPLMEKLSLNRCSKIESTSLLQAALTERLRELDISYVGSLQTSDLLAILSRCPKLERLAFIGCKVLGSSCLRQIEQSSVSLNLREVDISAVRDLAIVDFTAILAHSPQLESLRAPNLAIVELTDCLVQLRKCTEIRELDFSHPSAPRQPSQSTSQPRFGGFGIGHGQRGSTETSNVSAGFIHPSAMSSLLQSCPKLERLLLAGCHISDSTGIRQLLQCSNLREIDLSSVTTVVASDLAQGLGSCLLVERLSVAGLKAPLEQLVPPTGLPRLTYLDVGGSGMTNNSLRRLRGLFPRLRTLNMKGCRNVNESGLMTYLPRLQQLRCLDLRGVSGVTGALLGRLRGSHLRKLRLEDVIRGQDASRPTTKDAAELALGCRSLQFLGLGANEGDEICKEVGNMIKRRLSPHWAFFLCVNMNRVSYSQSSSQSGPLFIVDAGTVDWDKD